MKYRSLQLLSKIILRMEEVKYGEDDNEIHGVLFGWCMVMGGICWHTLEIVGSYMPKNRLRKKGIALFTDGSGLRYPDFIMTKWCRMRSINVWKSVKRLPK